MTRLLTAPHRDGSEGARRAGQQQFDRDELADFLRRRREALAPERVGLASVGRRRTPGLRRDEMAALACPENELSKAIFGNFNRGPKCHH